MIGFGRARCRDVRIVGYFPAALILQRAVLIVIGHGYQRGYSRRASRQSRVGDRPTIVTRTHLAARLSSPGSPMRIAALQWGEP